MANEKTMTMKDFRETVENRWFSGSQIGSAIYDAVKREDFTKKDYKIMLEIVANRLLGYVSDCERLKNQLDSCQTVEQLRSLMTTLDFGEYNERGVPISRMIADRMCELYDKRQKNQSFWTKLKGLFK